MTETNTNQTDKSGRNINPVLATGLDEIKAQMLKYRDFYGGDISEIDMIENATTKEELAAVLNKHEHLLEDMLCDARSHLNNFRKKVGLMSF